jgi:peptide/nickel transport system permease protein
MSTSRDMAVRPEFALGASHLTWPGCAFHAARKRPAYAVAALTLAIVAFVAVFGSLLPLADPATPQLLDRLRPPFTTGTSGVFHVAGTDQLGRDVLSRTVSGARVSVGIALMTALISGPWARPWASSPGIAVAGWTRW